MPESDPRIFFAAERTLLAWVRTSLGLIGLGFVVAKFGLFLRLMRVETGEVIGHAATPWIGAGLSLLGALAASAATLQHQRYYRLLGKADLPAGYRTEIGLIIGYGVAVAGIALSAFVAL